MSVIINLYGGPGSGKSTTSAAVYSKLKSLEKSVELCREAIKEFAYRGVKPEWYERPYLYGVECKTLGSLLGKVDYIVTDSPLPLYAFYESKYNTTSLLTDAVTQFEVLLKKQGHQIKNFYLKRSKKFVKEGRFETEEQAKAVDGDLLTWLQAGERSVELVGYEGEAKADFIVTQILNGTLPKGGEPA